jgi:hypothetical protein
VTDTNRIEISPDGPIMVVVSTYGQPCGSAGELDLTGAPEVFFAEEYPIPGGQRSQRIRFESASARAGAAYWR